MSGVESMGVTTPPLVRTIIERGGAWLRLVMATRPGNVLSLEMIRSLSATLDEARSTKGLKWLTIEGHDGEFSFGARIQEHLPESMKIVLPETHRLLRQLLDFPAPTAALVEGRCLGGGFELALSCDDIIASANAVFGLPEVRLGAFPPAGAALLPVRVGASRATRAIVTGDVQSAAYWHDAGLVSVVASQATLVEAATGWFDRHFATRSSVALGHAARAARLTLKALAEPAIAAAERIYLDELLGTRDALEGIQAWIDKREPSWEDD
jgi:cyclohexa-1,5-dienecarbonyl-CoA hydratase